MSFNDLLTVLLTFFILYVSMSEIRAEKVQDVSFAAARSFRTDVAEDRAEKLARSLSTTQGIQAHRVEGGVAVALSESLLFQSGSAEIVRKEILAGVGERLKAQRGAICVEGHTDSVPIVSSAYPSNWELSTQRAVNTVKLLVNECGIDPRRLSAAGYGDSRPLAPNDTPEGRALNRRINIILSLQ